MKNLIPAKLQEGDTVAAITLSWAGAGTYPHRYEIGKEQFEKEFNLKVIETPNALKGKDFIYNNPEARAEDLIWAFENPDVKAIISIIGGEDSIRILPYVDLEVIKRNPKIFLGYSDTTITHFMCLKAGLISFYGPAFMAGFAENCGMHQYMIDSLRKTLFEAETIGIIPENKDGWTVEFSDWADSKNQSIKRKLRKPTGWKWLQGEGIHKGHLIGGCMDVLEFIKGTELWPDKNIWKGAILFIETSEEAPAPSSVKYWLRNYGAQGILKNINGILFGRPGGANLKEEKYGEYDEILQQVAREYGRADLPIISHMDFGHTDPIMTIPIGAMATIDMGLKSISIDENAVK